MSLLPEGFDIDSPARFEAGMSRAQWFEHCMAREEEHIRLLAQRDQREAEEREMSARATKRAEARARKWFEDLPSPDLDAARERAQQRLDGLVPMAVTAYLGMLDAALAGDAPSDADLVGMFRIGVKHFGWLPPEEALQALEQRA